MYFKTEILKFMSLAIDEAKKADINNEVPVGSVVIFENKIIGRGFNQTLLKNSVTSHAEIMAINDASNYLNNHRLNGCIIFSTLEPCHMCAKAIVDARIKKLYFGAKEPKTGAIVSVDNFFDKPFLNHKVEFEGGFLEAESIEILQHFFQKRR